MKATAFDKFIEIAVNRRMAIQALSSEEVLARMRDLASRASAIQARIEQSALNPADGLRAFRAVSGPGFDRAGLAQTGERLDFQEVLQAAVRGVSDAQGAAQSKAQAYQLGDDKVSLEEVMISMQRASLAMQGMVQVRNRLVEAYREVMNMQV